MDVSYSLRLLWSKKAVEPKERFVLPPTYG